MAQILSDMGPRIRRLRIETGMSMTEFAAYVGVSYERYRLWEAGRTEPTVGSIRKLRRVFRQLLDREIEWKDILGA